MDTSISLKLDRAREHLEAVKSEIALWVESNPYRIIDEHNPNSPMNSNSPNIWWLAQHRRFRLERVAPVPGRILVIVGDCLFNARSALDHLALTLALSFTPGMTDKQIHGSEFPVFGATAMDAQAETKKIGCMDPAARDIIRSLQPSRLGSAYDTHPLWQLHDFNRIDKHRSLVACTPVNFIGPDKYVSLFIPEGQTFKEAWNIKQWVYDRVINTELIPGAILMLYAVIPLDPEKQTNVQPRLPIEVRLGKTGVMGGQPLVPFLEAILDFVSNTVVAQLSKFL